MKDKDKDKKKKEKEETSHLEEFYRLNSPQDIAQISLNKQKSKSLFLYGNLRNNIIKKYMIKDVLQEKQNKQKQKHQGELQLREYASNKLVPQDILKQLNNYFLQKNQIIDEYNQKYRVNKVFCKALKIKFENTVLYTSLGETQRKKMWLIGTDALFQIKENKHYYEKIQKSKDIPNVYEDFIEKDVVRSFTKQENEQNQSFVKETTQKLRNVLSTHSKRNCISGYTQGMNFIAKFILSLKFTEEEAFWIFEYFLENIIPLDYYTHNMIGLLADQNIFKNLIQSHNPKVFKKFQEIKIDINIITTSWFICLYTNSLSPQICHVVFDHCILYGAQTVFSVGLVIFDILTEDILKEKGDFMKVLDQIHLIEISLKIFLIKKWHVGLMKINIFNILLQIAEVLMMIEEKARKITDQQLIHQKLNEIYISKKGIELQREIYREVYKKQMDDDQKIHKQIRNYDSIKCNRNWPICLVNLHTQQKNNFQGVFVFKNNHDLQIKKDHHSLEVQSKNKRLFQTEDFSNVNNFLIVRLNHICENKHQIQSPKKSYNQNSQIQQSQTISQYTQKSKIQQQEKNIQTDTNIKNQLIEGKQDSFSPDKQQSYLRVGNRVESYFPTEEEQQQIMENRNKALNLTKIKEENQNQLSPKNQADDKKEYEEYDDHYDHTPKQIFTLLHSCKLQDDIDDIPSQTNEKYKEDDEKNNLRKSSYYKFYSKVKGNNPVFKSLQKKDISLAQSQYFEEVQH